MAEQSRAAFEEWSELDHERYQILRLIPRFPQALSLSPIESRLLLEVDDGSPELQAVEDFGRFGAPFKDIPGTVTSLTGPAGLHTPKGRGTLTLLPLMDPTVSRPDLEVRLVAADGTMLHDLELVGVRSAAATSGPGSWLAGHDRGKVLDFQFFMNGPDGTDEVRILAQSIAGLAPGLRRCFFLFGSVMKSPALMTG